MSQSEGPSTTAPSIDPRELREERKGCGCPGGCLAILAFLAIAFGLLMVGIPVGARYIARKDLSPDQIRQLEELRSKPVHFPKEWADVKPYSPDLKAHLARVTAAASALPTTVTAYLENSDTSVAVALISNMHGTTPTLSEAQSTVTRMGEAASQYVDELRRTAEHPEYEADAFQSLGMDFIGSLALLEPGYYQKRWLLIAAVAERLSRRDCEAAAEAALLPLQLAQRHPASALHGQADAWVYISAHQVLAVAEECSSTETLSRTLQEMNRLENQIPWTSEHSKLLLKSLGKLRSYKREGYPASLEPGKSVAHYAMADLEAEIGLFAEHMVNNLPLGDPRRAEYQKSLDQLGVMFDGPVRISSVQALRFVRMLAPDLLLRFLEIRQGLDNAQLKIGRVYYDLTRLKLARQLAQQEGVPVTTETRSLVPRYLPADPVDPYTGTAYMWDENTAQHYSPGPDKKDDKLRLMVDWRLRLEDRLLTGDIAVPAEPDPAADSLYWY